MVSPKARILTGKTKVAGVIGWPVSHSLSPMMHNYWLSHYIIDGVYIPLPTKPQDLGEVIKALPKMGFRGVNLTIPHKQLALSMLDSIDEDAKLAGAVNTITIDSEGRMHGSNTDIYGFAKNIRPHLPSKKSKAVVLGAGGAARAICQALAQEGFGQIVIVNRTIEKAEEIAKTCKGGVPEAWENRSKILDHADLLVNATNLGFGENEALIIDLDALPKHAVVTDVVYSPLATSLLRRAKANGCRTVDGLGMLMHQAVPGFKAWYGVTPEVTTELRKHLMDYGNIA